MERLAFTGSQTASPPPPPPRRAAPAPRGAAVVADIRLERLDTLAYSAFLAFTFVLFVRPQDTLVFLQAFNVADLTAGLALIALAAGRMGRGAPLTRITPELGLVLALGGVMIATAPFSVWPGGALGVFTDLYFKVILVFALLVNTLTTRARLDRLITVVVLGTSYIAVRAVFDYFRGVNLHEDGRVGGAVGGLFGNPNDMALNMVAFLPLAIVIALRRGSPVLRGLALVGIMAMALAIVFSRSRGGAIGLVAMLLVLLYQMRRVRPGIAALIVVATLAGIPLLPASFTARMSSIVNPEEDPTGSREARKRLLREGYQAFLENPVLGLGAGQFMNYKSDEREEPWRDTHNAALQVAAELGIMGLLIFVLLVGSGFAAVLRAGSALRRARGRRRARAPDPSRTRRDPLELYAAALVASLTGWFAAAMFASVAYYWTFYIVFGIAVAYRDIVFRELSRAARTTPEPERAEAA